MAKLLFILLLAFVSVSCFAESIKNSTMQLSFGEEKNNIFLTGIKDVGTGTEFIKEATENKNLWQLSVKKAKDYSGREIVFSGDCAEKVTSEKTGNRIVFHWENVKTEEMTEYFDVTCAIELKGENSYWDINVKTPENYGIWYVKFPVINDIDAQNGDQWMYPLRGNGFILDEFDKGLVNHGSVPGKDYYLVNEIGYSSPTAINVNAFTKKGSTLYMSPEDRNFEKRDTHLNWYVPNHVDYSNINFPAGMAEGGKDFVSQNRFNLALIKGDWYNAAKKYRKWGLKNNIAAFSKGKTENRKDIPQWLKKNSIWLRWILDNEKSCESIIRSAEYFGVPCGVHVYQWSVHPFDVFYPEWLPAKSFFAEQTKLLQEKGLHVMPYSNGHLVDINNSKAFKEFGGEILSQKENGEYYEEHWARDKGARNACGCIDSEYRNIYKNEMINIFKEIKPDALYIDQIGAANQLLCFNPNHNHAIGGGNDYIKTYNKFADELREELSAVKGENVPICTEDTSEAINFDMWLRVNDGFAGNTDTPLPNVVYSEYTFSIADNVEGLIYYANEFGKKDGIDPEDGMMKMCATALVNGTQIGWHCGSRDEFRTYSIYGNYMKNAGQARNAYVEFFNFGEVMRKPELYDIPSKPMLWVQWNGNEIKDQYLVSAGTFKYKGKVLLCFTNISEKTLPVTWSGIPEDMGLAKKTEYKINEVWPNKSEKTEILKGCRGEFEIGPYETKLFMIK